MAAAESNETKCAEVTYDGNAATNDGPVGTIARRQIERYQFRLADLLYYGLSVSFFLLNVATGEQRVYNYIPGISQLAIFIPSDRFDNRCIDEFSIYFWMIFNRENERNEISRVKLNVRTRTKIM